MLSFRLVHGGIRENGSTDKNIHLLWLDEWDERRGETGRSETSWEEKRVLVANENGPSSANQLIGGDKVNCGRLPRAWDQTYQPSKRSYRSAKYQPGLHGQIVVREKTS